jgi:hypothetical protein
VENNQEKKYWNSINKILDTMKENIYDTLSSFDHSSKYDMIEKIKNSSGTATY